MSGGYGWPAVLAMTLPQVQMLADAVEARKRRDTWLMGLAVRCGGATDDGWQQFDSQFSPE